MMLQMLALSVAALTVLTLNQAPAASLLPAQERALEPKDSFKECAACPEMVVVPAGEFLMGSSPETDADSAADERPQHRVAIANAFAVGKFPVTFDEWDACAADGGCNGRRPSDAGWGRGRRPVINVSWDDAQGYLAWLSAKTGHRYRLLSEAEWEYVARAGTATPFWWGQSITTRQANYDPSVFQRTDEAAKHRQMTVPVDAFEPNPWGLYQVHGNVYDWVEDCFNESYRGAPADGSAWLTGDCTRRSHRGGSWFSHPWALRSASRNRNLSVAPADFISFRVARSLAR